MYKKILWKNVSKIFPIIYIFSVKKKLEKKNSQTNPLCYFLLLLPIAHAR